MQRERLNKQNKPSEEKKEGYIIIPNYFLREYIKILGVGPVMFYQYLLTYCHKNKNTAWPSLSTSSKDTGITKKTLTKYYRILIQYGLIKKFSKKKLSSDGYMRNIYQLTPLDGEKITLHKGNFYHNIGVKITPNPGKKLPLNNTNLNITNTTTNGDAVAVDFKKLKEKGDLSAPACAYPHADRCNAQAEEKMQAIREQLMDLDFEESFIEKLLKDFPAKKIEEKLDLLLIKRNIQNPAGWLMSALKNNYQDPEQERDDEELAKKSKDDKCRGTMHRAHIIPNVTESSDSTEHGNLIGRGLIHQTRPESDNKNILSSEEAAKRFKLLRQKLKAMN